MRNRVLKSLVVVGGLVAMLSLAWGAAPAAAGTVFPQMDVKLGHSGVLEMSYHKGSLRFAELMK